MQEFKLKSGNALVVSMAAFEDGNELRKAYTRCQLKSGLDGYESEQAVQGLLCDDEMERRVFECAKSATYAGAKVDRKLFDDTRLREDARGDYFEIFAKVLGVNLNPFFKNASSESGAASPNPASGQTLK